MSWIIFNWLRKRKIGTDTIFVITTLGNNHIIGAVVIKENSFERNIIKPYFSGNIEVENEPEKNGK